MAIRTASASDRPVSKTSSMISTRRPSIGRWKVGIDLDLAPAGPSRRRRRPATGRRSGRCGPDATGRGSGRRRTTGRRSAGTAATVSSSMTRGDLRGQVGDDALDLGFAAAGRWASARSQPCEADSASAPGVRELRSTTGTASIGCMSSGAVAPGDRAGRRPAAPASCSGTVLGSGRRDGAARRCRRGPPRGARGSAGRAAGAAARPARSRRRRSWPCAPRVGDHGGEALHLARQYRGGVDPDHGVADLGPLGVQQGDPHRRRGAFVVAHVAQRARDQHLARIVGQGLGASWPRNPARSGSPSDRRRHRPGPRAGPARPPRPGTARRLASRAAKPEAMPGPDHAVGGGRGAGGAAVRPGRGRRGAVRGRASRPAIRAAGSSRAAKLAASRRRSRPTAPAARPASPARCACRTCSARCGRRARSPRRG